jgi:CRISPR-associated protein Cmr5
MPQTTRAVDPPAPTPPLALQRAKHALAAIKALERDKARIGKYTSYVKGLPANILRGGLGQAMAMELAGAKKDKGHKILFEQVEEWLLRGWANSCYRGQPSLLEAIVVGDQAKYVRAQAEALAYLEWLKKFAVAFLEEPDEANTGNGGGSS